MKHHLAWLLLVASSCCSRASSPSRSDAGITITSASDCSRACLHLRDLGCPEGTSTHCPAACQTMVDLSSADSVCWLDAGTVAAVQACGGVRCIP